MGRVVNIQRTAAGLSSWTVDKDDLIVGIASTAIASVSRNANDTAANVQTPAANIAEFNIIAAIVSTARMTILPEIPVYKDEVIYISFAAAGTAHLYMADLPTAD